MQDNQELGNVSIKTSLLFEMHNPSNNLSRIFYSVEINSSRKVPDNQKVGNSHNQFGNCQLGITDISAVSSNNLNKFQKKNKKQIQTSALIVNGSFM